MRYILIIGDGIADRPVHALAGKTPLESLELPALSKLAGGLLGRARTVPKGAEPGSDTAILSIFGYDPRANYTGRAALEAAGAGVALAPGELAWRVNLCAVHGERFRDAVMRSHNGGGIDGRDALDTVAALRASPAFASLAKALRFTLHESASFRQMATAPGGTDWGAALPGPHDHLGERVDTLLPPGGIRLLVEASFEALRGRQANCIWPWCPGEAMRLEGFSARYGHSGPVISAVPLVKGIAALCGLAAPVVDGATGTLNTNYAGKVKAALAGLRAGADFAAIHVEAPDECAHALDLAGKLEAIRRIDSRIVRPLLRALEADGEPFRVLFLSDHPTHVETGAHDGAAVPFCVYDSRNAAAPRAFSERAAATGVCVEDGTLLMRMLFDTAF